jgi:hypothetical protein
MSEIETNSNLNTDVQNQEQQNVQDPTEYKNYFNDKFISLFVELLSSLIELLQIDSNERNNLIKIMDLKDKLNYEKIMKKLEDNKQLIEITNILLKYNNADESYYKFFTNKEKFWTLMPSFNLNKILLEIQKEYHKDIFMKLNNLQICAITYNKVIEQINISARDNKEFSPFDSIGNSVENMDIKTLFEGVEVKNMHAYEMLMSALINNETNNKMDEYLGSIKESDVNEAANKLNDVLNSDNFNGNRETSLLLSDMLSEIKTEVMNLKNNSENMKGKQGMEQLLGIAQKVAGGMMNKINSSEVSVLEIWDATSSLAKNTVKSSALDIVDNLIRSNIVANMNAKYEEEKVKEHSNEKNEFNTNEFNTNEFNTNEFNMKEQNIESDMTQTESSNLTNSTNSANMSEMSGSSIKERLAKKKHNKN